MDAFFENPWVKAAITVIIAAIIFFVLDRIGAKQRRNKNKKLFNFSKLVLNSVRILVIVITVLVVIQGFGVDVSSILASVGVASAIIGLALQDAMKDIIAGANILADNYFSPGDYVKIGSVEGKVINVGLKVTKIRSSVDGSEVTIANRNITESTRISPTLSLTVGFAAATPIVRVKRACAAAVKQILEMEQVKGADYTGISDIDGKFARANFMISCERADDKNTVKSAALNIIKAEFDRCEIAMK